MTAVRIHYQPVPFQDSPYTGRLILRDGTTAQLRPSAPTDKAEMKRFFAAQSSDSRRHRFFSLAAPKEEFIDAFCDSAHPRVRLTLVVTRLVDGAPRIVAVGSYMRRDDQSAEIALSVDDALHGKGVGTLILERLAIIAVSHGVHRLWAVTMAENQPMLEVFRQSGFECHSRANEGFVQVELSITPSQASVERAEFRDRVATAASLRPFFEPNAVAIVGASRNPQSIGARILNALIAAGFHGPLYPVNPRAESIGALTAYTNLRLLPDAPDLVVVAVPRDAVLSVIDDAAARGARAAILITAGFAEVGAEGRQLQNQLVEKIRGYGMRMVGPNCLGLLNTDPAVRLNASFAPDFPPVGNVAFGSQSGALGLAIIALARERGLGISKFVSVGNKADVSGNDLLQYWEEDPRSDVILLYLESFGNPRRFARVAQRVSRRKPIVAVKAGRTAAGHRAASSHTAALAAPDTAVDALFHQTGVIRAETLDEMFDLATALRAQPLPHGRRVGILTNAGGLGILCADACEANGLQVQEISAATKERLREFLPTTASVTNPVDMIASASAEDFHRATAILLNGGEIDALIVLTIHVGIADLAAIRRNVAQAAQEYRKANGDKPVLTCIMDGQKLAAGAGPETLPLPNYAFPENCARVLGKLADYAEWRARDPGVVPEFDDIDAPATRRLCQQVAEQRGAGWLSGAETRQLLSAFKLPLLAGAICRSADDAAATATQVGFPVALKLSSLTIVHKTEIGGVQLNLQNGDAVRAAFNAITERLSRDGKLTEMDGVLVQPMISGGVELMIGVTQDPSFGPLIAFGLGGIHVEILKDVSFRITPITDRDAAEMVRSLRGFRLLEGYRGHPPADLNAIEETLLRVARLVEEVPQISELDLNPLIALPPGQGCWIVDARIRVG